MGVTGTTTPMFIGRESQRGAVEAGKSYFDVRIAAAQAYFDGRIWERARQLIVTSRVTLNHPMFGAEPINAIQRSRPIRRGATESLGLSSNLIQLVPATMTRVSVSVEFLVDKENRLAALGGLINDDAFLAAVSLAPGAALVAKTIAALSQKVIQSVFTAEERQPILQFNGDFNLSDGSLRDGYYAIVATQDEENPLPDRNTLSFEHDQLLTASTAVERLSYVVLDVRRVDRRGRDLNEGAEWDKKLRAAEAIAEGMQFEFGIDGQARAGYWKECMTALKEAQVLLYADANYLRDEARTIMGLAFQECQQKVLGTEGPVSSARVVQASRGSSAQDARAERDLLDLPLEGDLTAGRDDYLRQVASAYEYLGLAAAS
jgi:hypothetical protein